MTNGRIFVAGCFVAVVSLGFWYGRTGIRAPAESRSAQSSSELAVPGHEGEPKPENISSAENGREQLAGILAEPDVEQAEAIYLRRLEALKLAELPAEFSLLLDRNYSEIQQRLIRILLRRWVGLDPTGALETELARAGNASKYINDILAAWAQISPEAALAWVKQSTQGLLSGGIKAERFNSVLQPAIKAGNFTWVAGILSEVSGTGNLIDGFMMAWADSDAAAAGQWAASLPRGANRVGALRGFIRNVASTDPDLAGSMIRSWGDPEERNAMASAAFAGWGSAESNTPRLRWLAEVVGTNANGDFDDVIRQAAVNQSSAADADLLRSLVARVSHPLQRRSAAGMLTDRQLQASPSEALITTMTFFDGDSLGSRNGQVGVSGSTFSVLSIWAQSDRGAAEDFVRSSPRVPENLRPLLITALEKQIPRPPEKSH